MKKISKQEVLVIMAKLKTKYSNEELACMIEKSAQTIWSYASDTTKRIPGKSDYEVLKRLAK